MYFYMRNIRKFIINRIFALYITHRLLFKWSVRIYTAYAGLFFLWNTTRLYIRKRGEGVFSYEYIDRLRNLKNDFNVIAQSGGQENSLASDADIVIMGGNVAVQKHLLY